MNPASATWAPIGRPTEPRSTSNFLFDLAVLQVEIRAVQGIVCGADAEPAPRIRFEPDPMFAVGVGAAVTAVEHVDQQLVVGAPNAQRGGLRSIREIVQRHQ